MCLISFAACNSKTDSPSITSFKNLTSDSLLQERISTKVKALNISDISKGVDSFEFRIWYGLSIATPKQLVTMKYQDSTWTLTKTDYWLDYKWVNGRPVKALLDSSFTISRQLNFDVPKFVDSILQFRIDTFPSQYDIPNFQDRVADGMFYEFELATSHFYKAVVYFNPQKYQDVYDRKIANLIQMLRKIGVYSMP